jgi:hypothetical protein
MPKATRPKSRPSTVSKPATSSSTSRRLALADFIDSFGDVMPLACQYCRQNSLVCRVHVRSGKCNHCHRHNNSDCNIRISEEEWSSMKQEKVRLQERLAAVQHQRSLLDQEERDLRRALHDTDQRAAEAIAVEERSILLQEQQEQVDGVAGLSLEGPSLSLSPFTWSALDGLPDMVWDGTSVPHYLESPVTSSFPETGAVATSSS